MCIAGLGVHIMLPFPWQELPGHLDALLRPLAGVPSQVWGQHHRDARHLAGGSGPAQCCILHLDCLLGIVGTVVHVWVSTVRPLSKATQTVQQRWS